MSEDEEDEILPRRIRPRLRLREETDSPAPTPSRVVPRATDSAADARPWIRSSSTSEMEEDRFMSAEEGDWSGDDRPGDHSESRTTAQSTRLVCRIEGKGLALEVTGEDFATDDPLPARLPPTGRGPGEPVVDIARQAHAADSLQDPQVLGPAADNDFSARAAPAPAPEAQPSRRKKHDIYAPQPLIKRHIPPPPPAIPSHPPIPSSYPRSPAHAASQADSEDGLEREVVQSLARKRLTDAPVRQLPTPAGSSACAMTPSSPTPPVEQYWRPGPTPPPYERRAWSPDPESSIRSTNERDRTADHARSSIGDRIRLVDNSRAATMTFAASELSRMSLSSLAVAAAAVGEGAQPMRKNSEEEVANVVALPIASDTTEVEELVDPKAHADVVSRLFSAELALGSKTAALQEVQQRLAAVDDELRGTLRTLHDKLAVLERVQSENDDLRGRSSSDAFVRDMQQIAVKKAKVEQQRLRDELCTAKQRLEDMSMTASGLQQQLEQAKRDSSQAADQATAAEEAQRRLDKAEREAGRLSSRLEADAKQHTLDIERLQTEINRLQRLNEESAQKLSSQQQLVRQHKLKSDRFEAENKRLRASQSTAATSSLDKLNAAGELTQKQAQRIRAMEEEIVILRKAAHNVGQGKTAIDAIHERERDDLRRSKAALESDNDRLRGETLRLEREIEGMRDEAKKATVASQGESWRLREDARQFKAANNILQQDMKLAKELHDAESRKLRDEIRTLKGESLEQLRTDMSSELLAKSKTESKPAPVPTPPPPPPHAAVSQQTVPYTPPTSLPPKPIASTTQPASGPQRATETLLWYRSGSQLVRVNNGTFIR